MLPQLNIAYSTLGGVISAVERVAGIGLISIRIPKVLDCMPYCMGCAWLGIISAKHPTSNTGALHYRGAAERLTLLGSTRAINVRDVSSDCYYKHDPNTLALVERSLTIKQGSGSAMRSLFHHGGTDCGRREGKPLLSHRPKSQIPNQPQARKGWSH